jgi:hypothetical protein
MPEEHPTAEVSSANEESSAKRVRTARSAERGLRLQNPTSRKTLARETKETGKVCEKFAAARGRKEGERRGLALSQQKPRRLISVAILIAF